MVAGESIIPSRTRLTRVFSLRMSVNQMLNPRLTGSAHQSPVIMILRVYALYGRNRLILAFLLFLWVAQVTLSSIGMTTGFGG